MSEKGSASHTDQPLEFDYLSFLYVIEDCLGFRYGDSASEASGKDPEFEAMNSKLCQGITTLINCTIAHWRKLITGSRKPSQSNPIMMKKP